MKKILAIPIIATVLILVSISSCSEDSSTFVIGEDWVNSYTKVYYVDSLTIKASTFKFDSLAVSSTSKLLIGAYSDPTFGLIKSKVFLQLYNATYTLDDDAQFDSIALVLKLNGYYYNDTIPKQELRIYEVEDDIEPNDDDDTYYNTTSFNTSSNAIADLNFQFKPNKVDSLNITLSNSFGSDLFEKIQENDINNIDEFYKEYKGLLIEPDESNTTVFGFSKESYVRVYYSLDNETEEDENYFDLTISATNSFHNISSNLENTSFSEIENEDVEIPSYQTNNNSFIQAGVGIATKIDIPNLETIYDIPGTGTLMDANLKISLKKNSSTNYFKTRDSLQVFIIDNKYNPISSIYAYTSSEEVVYGLISSQNDEFSLVQYNIPLKYFLDLKLTETNGENFFLALYSQDYNQSVDRYILNGEDSSDNLKVKLELIYAVYDE